MEFYVWEMLALLNGSMFPYIVDGVFGPRGILVAMIACRSGCLAGCIALGSLFLGSADATRDTVFDSLLLLLQNLLSPQPTSSRELAFRFCVGGYFWLGV